MKTFPITNEDGNHIGFEINNLFISLRTIAKVLASIKGVSEIKRRKLFGGFLSGNNEVHITFSFLGNEWIVWEPFGDNSRYSIRPADENIFGKIDIWPVRNAFSEYKTPIVSRFMDFFS